MDSGDDERFLGDALHLPHHAVLQVYKTLSLANAVTCNIKIHSWLVTFNSGQLID